MARGRVARDTWMLAIAVIAAAGCAPTKSRQTSIVAALEALDESRRGPSMNHTPRMPTEVAIATSTDPDSVECVAINYAPPELPDSGFVYCAVIEFGIPAR
jgi:hypothetical protein